MATLPRSAFRFGLVGFAGALLLAPPALSADLAPAQPLPSAPAIATDGPVVFASAYLWASALSGTTSTLPPLPATNIDVSFRDVLQDLDGAVMAAGEIRWGRWSFLADVMYTQVSPGGTLPGPFQSGVDVRSRSLTLQADALYRLHDSPTLAVDAGVGLRFWHLDNRLTIEPGLLPTGISYSQSASWVDPVFAARIIAQLGGPWSLTLVGDVGGFDVGAQFTWQAIGTVNYQWTSNLALRAGYRMLSVDYQEGNFLYDVQMQGPILGMTYRF